MGAGKGGGLGASKTYKLSSAWLRESVRVTRYTLWVRLKLTAAVYPGIGDISLLTAL